MKNSVRKAAALGQGLKNTNKWKSRERLAREDEKEEPTERWKESQKKEPSGGEGREFLESVVKRFKCCLDIKQDMIWKVCQI